MRYYEAIYIVHPNLEDAALAKVVETTKQALAKRGGELVFDEIMGKKRLAYAVEKQRFGTYVLLQFQGEGVDIAKFSQDFELHDDIIAQMIVSIEADEIRTLPPPTVEITKADASEAKSDTDAEPATEPAKEDEGTDKPAEQTQESTAEGEAADDSATEATEDNGGDEAATDDSGSDEVAEVDAKADSPV
ncbi:MAG: 30S ribosomal protein S6 [Candidatus Marinimicrobia bacterium]|nr:30S ribosomal protein S6 [Candidatus Neomarinimicrobiota bacterium]